MRDSKLAPAAARAEWTGRLLVGLQFGLLALMAWRAWGSPAGLGMTALALLAAASAVALWALWANRPGNFNIRPTPRSGAVLVTHGPYRWVRHPMYTAVLLAAAAAAVQAQQLTDAVLWAALLAVLLAKAGLEEAALAQRFADYAAYRLRTGKLLPWLF
jgi:protein-S-isoprenylcysteine O-methyltransferase Ste14